MKLIQLTKGYEAKVSDEDYEELMQWSWHYNCGYARRSRSGDRTKATLMHRQVAKTPDHLVTDHINGDTLDNRRENLRNCTQSQNRLAASNTRDVRGISYSKYHKKWQAYYQKDGRRRWIGYYKDKVDAAKAYNEVALTEHGEYAILNDIRKLSIGQ